MDYQLTGKTALVTGGSAGIGLAIARTLAAEGAGVVINGRDEGRVAAAIDSIRSSDARGSIRGITADLATAGGAEKVVAELPQVDILVNNVGIYEPKPFLELSDEDWQRTFDVNVMSGVRLSRAYFDAMLKSNWGRILFISSESAVQIPKEMIQYGMSKAAQVAIARGLAEMTAGTDVTVNSILVGPTRSEGVTRFISQAAAVQHADEKTFEAQFFERARPTSLIQRFLDPAEIAHTVAFLASPLSSGINGTAVRADGGVIKSAF